MNERDREKILNWKTSSVIGCTQSRDRGNGVIHLCLDKKPTMADVSMRNGRNGRITIGIFIQN